ncbi:Reverse transcriptase precursor [Phytophthora megakarya]|uniref:Reverse transcriptase n=1 Tax=Phytophthora megakarya TaxID=4795 RepID=A0A225VE31_9STRA|nr:Reverse transcriptase precursor [Phytophthora megakarya]
MKQRIRRKTWHDGRSTGQLFKATSVKFSDNSKDITDSLSWPRDHHGPDAASKALIAEITEEKGAEAIGACSPWKACGPDSLNNDWYRDFEEQQTPILTILFNIWYKKGVFPNTFLETDIFCLKKSGDASNPLNYRPLALLNSDYKIFTRIIVTATRVSKSLSSRIHEHQNGFVPGRQIHDTIDLFMTAQVVIYADAEQHEAVALLLDFQKAYDSLNREFLIKAIAAHGYPQQFAQKAVARLHDGTRVRVLVNGHRSRWVEE